MAKEPTIMLREMRTGKLHPCLFSAVDMALGLNRYEVADPDSYRRLLEERAGAQRPGVVVKPEVIGDEPVEPRLIATATTDDFVDDAPVVRSLVSSSGDIEVVTEDEDEPRMVRLDI